MAPFKLKFRMGSSRSASQEVDVDPQANQSLLNNTNVGIGASNSTIDSADCTSLTSLGNDRRSLLPNNSNGEHLGYLNPVATAAAAHDASNNLIPESPPPSYEHALEESQKGLSNFNSNSLVAVSTVSGGGAGGGENSDCGMSHIQDSSINTSRENLSNECTDPDCTARSMQECTSRRSSMEPPELTAPTCHENTSECTGSCDRLLMSPGDDETACGRKIHHHQCEMNDQTDHQHQPQTLHCYQDSQQDCQSLGGENDNCSDEDWDSHQGQATNIYNTEITTSEIISNKSSKAIYKAVAKQWGITCKMSEQCRCMECQSNYFDCEFDENEHQKTDGGLGAGTPMFISEVMHGTACTIL